MSGDRTHQLGEMNEANDIGVEDDWLIQVRTWLLKNQPDLLYRANDEVIQ